MKSIARVDEIPTTGLKFTFRDGPFDEEGILLRLTGGKIAAYRNLCRHLPMALDEREPRKLWDASKSHLVCNSHGARFRPEDGLCVSGPCKGSHLKEVPISIVDGEVFVDTDRTGSFFDV